MSKLRDRIRDTATPRRKPIGFGRPAPETASSHILVIAEVTDPASARAAVEAGAGALLHTGGPDTLAAVVEAAGDVPTGARLEDATAESSAAAAAAGAGFFLFDAERTAAEALLQPQTGHVLILEDAPDDEGLRALAPLDLDAILVSPPPAAMTVRQQLTMRRLAGLAGAPLIAPLSAAPSATTLEIWRDAGAPAVLLSASAAEALPALLEAARAVPPPRQRTLDPATPLLPATTAPPHEDEPPPELDPFPETPMDLT